MNSIQRMLVIMIQFVIIYLLVLLPYPHAFQRMVRDSYGCNALYFDSFRNMTYRWVHEGISEKTSYTSIDSESMPGVDPEILVELGANF